MYPNFLGNLLYRIYSREDSISSISFVKFTLFQHGCIKALEEGPKRNFQPSQMSARRKKNKDLFYCEVRDTLMIVHFS